MTQSTDALRSLLQASQRAVFFTGAGISTESGIPDFRSPGGVWSKMKPILFSEFLASEDLRRESWRRRFSNTDGWVGAQPNQGHLAVAELIRRGKAIAVITQNVDNLHQQSGVPAHQVIELHGNSTYATCLQCQQRVELDLIEQEFTASGDVKPCACGGIIKPATISFGQQMPTLPMQQALRATLRTDLFIVLGSSLSVFPAADFPRRAKQNGARLVIVNRDATPFDELADLVIHDSIGAVMTAAIE
jgi:NAD-dependent deacetylase